VLTPICANTYSSGGMKNGKNQDALAEGAGLSVDIPFKVKHVFNTFLVNGNNKSK
jgi:hypothetical protein